MKLSWSLEENNFLNQRKEAHKSDERIFADSYYFIPVLSFCCKISAACCPPYWPPYCEWANGFVRSTARYLSKLTSFSTTISLVIWFVFCTSNRRCDVSFDGCASRFGIPQGSILGFFIFKGSTLTSLSCFRYIVAYGVCYPLANQDTLVRRSTSDSVILCATCLNPSHFLCQLPVENGRKFTRCF